MNWFGRLLGLIVALSGFAAAHLLVQTGSAQIPPVPTVSVTVPTVSVPTVSVPTVPPPTTPTVPVPSTPTPTVTVPVPSAPVPTVPAPTPTTVVPPPVRLPPSVTVPPPAPTPPTTTTTATAGSAGSAPSATPGTSAGTSSPSRGTATPPPSGSSGSSTSTSSGGQSYSAGRNEGSRSTARSRTRPLEARAHRSPRRVSVRLAFVLPRAERLFLIVRGPAPSCRIAGYIPVRGRKGPNTVLFAGRVHGRRLEPGIYLLSLSPNRRLVPGAPTEYVRVVSQRRSLPLPDSAREPSCSEAAVLATDPTARILLAEALPQTATARPTARVAGAVVASPTGDENDDGASGLPDPGVLGGATSAAEEEPFLALAVLTLVAGLLLAMLALVTRFLRGTWNP